MANVSISTGFDFFDRHTRTIERSKRAVKAGRAAPVYRLYIPFGYMTPAEYENMPGERVHDPDFGNVISKSWDWDLSEFSDSLVEASVSYDADGGAGMQLTLHGHRWMGYEGFPIILMAGYGNPSTGSTSFYNEIQPIFQGHIYDVDDKPNGITHLQCFANAKIRGSQVLGKYLDYRDLTLAEAMKDVMLRSGRFYGFKIRGGFDFVIHNPETDARSQPGLGEFQSETTYQEVQNTLVEPAGYVRYDCPFGEVIQARPTVKSGEFLVTNYTEGEYPKGGFTFKPGQRGFYAKVVVFRRAQDSDQTTGAQYVSLGPGRSQGYQEIYEVYADRNVDTGDRFHPPANRWYMVPDFNGTQEEAQIEANRLAQYFSETGGEFELETSLADFWLFDSFGIYRTEMPMPTNTAYLYGVRIPLRSGYKRLLAYYKCLIEDGIDFQISKQNFKVRLRGTGILANVAGVESPAELSYRSTGLVPLPGTTGDGAPPGEETPPPTYPWTYWGQEDIIFGDLTTVTFADLP